MPALLAAVALHVNGRSMTRQTALPFGPFLALGPLTTLALQAGLVRLAPAMLRALGLRGGVFCLHRHLLGRA